MEDRDAERRGWLSVLLCALMVFTTLGFCSSANSIYVVPVTQGLGITRSAYATTTTVRFVTMATVNVFFGALVRRFGVKRLILGGFASLIVANLLCASARGLPLLLAGSAFLGAGLAFTSTTMVGVIVHRACRTHTGLLTGIALAMNGAGAAVARVVLTPILYAGPPTAFRNAYRLVAWILFCAALILLIFLRDVPWKKRQAAPTDPGDSANMWRNVMRKPHFCLALVCVFCTGLVLQSVSGISDPYLKDSGVALGLITAIMSVHSLSLSGTKSAVGFLYDRAGVRVACSVCYGAALVALLSLLAVEGASFMVVPFALLFAVALPLQTVMLPILARELAGAEELDRTLGIFVGFNVAGYAVGGPVANLIFDVAGSYRLWILLSIGLIAAVCVGMNTALTFARRAREMARSTNE